MLSSIHRSVPIQLALGGNRGPIQILGPPLPLGNTITISRELEAISASLLD